MGKKLSSTCLAVIALSSDIFRTPWYIIMILYANFSCELFDIQRFSCPSYEIQMNRIFLRLHYSNPADKLIIVVCMALQQKHQGVARNASFWKYSWTNHGVLFGKCAPMRLGTQNMFSASRKHSAQHLYLSLSCPLPSADKHITSKYYVAASGHIEVERSRIHILYLILAPPDINRDDA